MLMPEGRPTRTIAAIEDISERKQAEEALRESETRYRSLFDETLEGIAVADAATGIILDCNHAMLKITGYDRDELIGRPQTMLHPKETGSRPVSGSFARHREDKRGEVLEERIVTKAGTLRDVEIKAGAVMLAGQEVLVGSFRDITEERRGKREREITLELLRLANDRDDLHDLIQSVLATIQRWTRCEAVGIRLLDGDDYPYYETLGFSPDFIEAENLLCERDLNGQIVRGPLGKPAMKCMCGNVLCGGFDPGLSFFTPNGSFWLNRASDLSVETTEAEWQARMRNRCGVDYESVALIPLKHGEEILGLLQLNDHDRDRFNPDLISFLEQLGRQIVISIAHRQSEAALRASEHRFRRLVEGLKDEYFFYQYVVDGPFTYVSPSVANVLGCSPEEYREHLAETLVDSPTNRQALLHREKVLAGIAQPAYDVDILHKDGSLRHLEALDTALIGRDGKVVAVDGIAHDVTARKRAAEDQERLQAQLDQVRKMEAIGQLAGGVAHDFNNILQAIFGYTEYAIVCQEAGKSCVEDLRGILKSAESAAGLTRQLLAFSRQQVLMPRVLDLNKVISDTEKMLRRLIGEDIILSTRLPATTRRVKVDPGQIEQVVMNLAVNARDAMPHGGQLDIETRDVELDGAACRQMPEARPGPFVLLSVRDTGCGMTAAVKARIFEPFFSTKGVGKGTGLGLATVFGIIKQSNGHIEVESVERAGSCFRIYLPAARPDDETLESVREVAAPSGSETILLVEDEETVRRIVRRILEARGYTVLEAISGPMALAVDESHKQAIDLLITDLVMPDMGGRQLAETLKARRPGMETIFISGYTNDAIVRNGNLPAGAAFLQKPFSPQALSKIVRDVLDARSSELRP